MATCVRLCARQKLLGLNTTRSSKYNCRSASAQAAASILVAESDLKPAESSATITNDPFSNQQEQQLHRIESFHSKQNRMRYSASSSIIVQGASKKHQHHLVNSCSQFADIQCLYHYTTQQKNFTIIQTASPEQAWNLVKNTSFPNQADVVPCRTRLLNANSGLMKVEAKSNTDDRLISSVNTVVENIISEAELLKSLRGATSISEQMMLFHEKSTLSPVGEMLRYFVGSQIEDCMHGFFRNCRSYLFGSSVNGFGRHGCDLDVMLDLDEEHSAQLRGITNSISVMNIQCKYAAGNERVQMQRNLEMIADFIKVWMPSFSHIQRILLARVPIVKFEQEAAGVSGDLCLNNASGVEMSEILYALGEMDCRLRPLVFLIRMWARAAQLTNAHKIPGRWLTNFHLSIFCVYFMQTRQLLPSLAELAAERNVHELVPNIRCRVSKSSSQSSLSDPNESLEQLLASFFVWLAAFDFKRFGFSIIDANEFVKPDFAAVYVQNPVEPELNISRNVGAEEVAKLQSAARAAVWHFENAATTREQQQQQSSQQDAALNWGILNLIIPSSSSTSAASSGVSSRIDLRSLFVSPSPDGGVNSISSSENDSQRQLSHSMPSPSRDAERRVAQHPYSVEVRAAPPASFSPSSSSSSTARGAVGGTRQKSMEFNNSLNQRFPPTAARQQHYQQQQQQQQQRRQSPTRQPQQQPQQHLHQQQRQRQPQQLRHTPVEQRLGRADATIMPVKRNW